MSWGGVLIQLSTYSSQENPQNEVRELVNLILDNGGFMLAAEVVENVNMMSLVYVRNVNWANELEILPDRYLRWRGR